ncbi:MAG: hypothetical protein QXL25_06840 [Candidatus Bathyarchaeia archaeon]
MAKAAATSPSISIHDKNTPSTDPTAKSNLMSPSVPARVMPGYKKK